MYFLSAKRSLYFCFRLTPKLSLPDILPFCKKNMSDNTVIVTISQGDLRGKKQVTSDGVTYYSFQGIPYAKPPVGALRFKAPESPESWTGIRDALSLGNAAPHFDIIKQQLVGDEDCLFLNVYTPEVKPDSPLPVMVFIHGGGFRWGSGGTDVYGPQPLMREGVILVTLNYRLGVLGFLHVPGTGVSANNGLKDQVAALKWVQKNISHFGGDKNNVTLFGESAGGFSVHHHILSPLTKGLIHKAIPMSGTALCSMALPQPNPNKPFVFGKEVGYDGDNPTELVKFLRGLSAEELASASNQVLRDMVLPYFSKNYMGAVLEEPGPDAFIVEEPLKRIRSKNFSNVPIMAGMTSAEGKVYFIMPMQHKPLSEFNETFEMFLPSNLKLQIGSDRSKEIAHRVKQFYFGDEDISDKTRGKFIEFLGDQFLAYGVHEMVKEHVKVNSTVFYYMFSFEGKFAYVSLAGKTAPEPGAGHGDELFYLFQSDEIDNDHKPGTPEYKVSSNIAKLWANFAKYGNPNHGLDIDWTPTTKENIKYLDINTELTLRENALGERMKFWEQIYQDVLGDRI